MLSCHDHSGLLLCAPNLFQSTPSCVAVHADVCVGMYDVARVCGGIDSNGTTAAMIGLLDMLIGRQPVMYRFVEDVSL